MRRFELGATLLLDTRDENIKRQHPREAKATFELDHDGDEVIITFPHRTWNEMGPDPVVQLRDYASRTLAKPLAYVAVVNLSGGEVAFTTMGIETLLLEHVVRNPRHMIIIEVCADDWCVQYDMVLKQVKSERPLAPDDEMLLA